MLIIYKILDKHVQRATNTDRIIHQNLTLRAVQSPSTCVHTVLLCARKPVVCVPGISLSMLRGWMRREAYVLEAQTNPPCLAASDMSRYRDAE